MALSDGLSLVVGGLDLVSGWAEPKVQPAPGAGVATVARVTPGETWERVRMARATFSASAVVANRLLTARLIDYFGNVLWETPIASPVVASTSVTVSLAPGVTTMLTASGLSVVAIPDIMLQAGFAWQLFAGANDAGDTWSALGLYLQRYPSDIVHSGAGA